MSEAETVVVDRSPAILSPLPGEPGIPNVAVRRPFTLSRKGLAGVGVAVVGILGIAAFTVQHFVGSGKRVDDESGRGADRPAAALSEARRLEMPALPQAPASAVASTPRIPAIVANEADPIGLRRTGVAAGTGSPVPLPEDAPSMLVTSRPGTALTVQPADRSGPAIPADPMAATTSNLQAYQRQLQGLMEALTKTTSNALGTNASPGTGAASASSTVTSPAGLFGGQLPSSATPRVAAGQLGDRRLTLPKGTAFTCALKTKVISATSGLVGCQVQRNVFGDDGRVLLVERGSHLDGEYRIASLRPGMVRIPVLWTRIRTPGGVTVDIDSPATGALGESGIDGFVDNRWGERLGAAMLLSLIDDAVKLVIQNEGTGAAGNTFVLPSTTANTAKLAEKVLDSTINIPPLVYRNQGGIVGIYVARDVDFSSVYALQPSAR